MTMMEFVHVQRVILVKGVIAQEQVHYIYFILQKVFGELKITKNPKQTHPRSIFKYLIFFSTPFKFVAFHWFVLVWAVLAQAVGWKTTSKCYKLKRCIKKLFIKYVPKMCPLWNFTDFKWFSIVSEIKITYKAHTFF